MVTCWICGEKFEPDPEEFREWVENDDPFDPTDWECPECGRWQDLHDELERGSETISGELEWLWGGPPSC